MRFIFERGREEMIEQQTKGMERFIFHLFFDIGSNSKICIIRTMVVIMVELKLIGMNDNNDCNK
jgi:hypothetical protein